MRDQHFDRERGPEGGRHFGPRGERGERGGPEGHEHHGRHFGPRGERGERGERRFGHRGGPPFGRGGPPFGHGGGPFGRGGGDPFGEDGGRRRHRRGDIKFVLLELLDEQPRHGYDLIKALEERYGGFYRPSPGSVYPTLQLLEDEGHLTSDSVDGKRVYTLTDSGRELLAERRRQEAAGEDPRRRGRPMREERPELAELRRTVEALLAGVMQVGQHGSAEQIRAAAALLDGARREVYRILAGEEKGA